MLFRSRAPEELAAIDGVAWVIGNSHQTEIPSLVESKSLVSIAGRAQHGSPPAQIVREEMRVATDLAVIPTEGILGERTRPTLKIQDGCNHRCAYCVIPFVRGRSRSLLPPVVEP